MLPRHRQPPSPEDLSASNVYVSEINALRQSIRGAKDFRGKVLGPIGHALDTIKDFDCSASEWGPEHLRRFQVVIFEGQTLSTMFLDKFIPKRNDPVMNALENDGFFNSTAMEVIGGNWSSNKLYNNFFLDMMYLLRPPRTPQARPITRNTKPRSAKAKAKDDISSLIHSEATADPTSPLTRVSSGGSMVSAGTSNQSGTVIYYGPRETSTHSLFHNYLKYIATIEYEHQKIGEEPSWLPCNDSESIPIVAAGAIFNCEHDGSVYMWEHQQFQMTEIHSDPVCIIECKREFHNKKLENIIAQEVAELIGMALQNYASENPSISAKDETYLLCCHHTTCHLSSAIITQDYIEAMSNDSLAENQYLIVRRSQRYDLANPVQRREITRQIIGLLRYLRSIAVAEKRTEKVELLRRF